MTKNVYWSPLIIILLLLALVVAISQLVIKKSDQTPLQQATDASHQKHYEWRMVTTWPKGLPGLGLAAENFARIVEQSSAGRLKVKVYGAGDLVPALGVFDAVSSGSVEMGHGAGYYWKGKIPASPFFTSVPFGMNAQEMNGWLFYGGGLELYREAYAPFNLMPFPAGNTGVQMAGWFNKEINNIADIKGTKMRIPGLAGEVWNRAGGVAVNIPGGELYTALQTGVIDATEWVGPYNDLALGFHQVAKYYYYPGWHEPGPTLELLVNKEAFESLPADLQSIVETTARAINQDMLDEYTARNNAALKTLISEHGVQLKQLPKEVLAELRKHADEMYSEFAQKDPFFAKVYENYREFADQAAQYHDISEQAYYQAN
ncbi:TRAP transporter substrate-binding protein DctP [uncultured Pseudoteredinibacter sp.]|uniref:TRAP transporter substrate-binding protein n=1 Tax=uncultured Pseudoteredinibacter sp. TaxID=1641701 RepID=UPI002608F2E8|nr:TRAP transporter substrate-binding protein DctP [uncultured Pseudoteredinibacter sp.]